MTAYFITATGTGIGKTFVTAGIVHALRARSEKVAALKPVISGLDAANFRESDSALLLDAMGEAVTQEGIARISPWRFAAPLSPDMAAAREKRTLDFDALVKFSRTAIAAHSGALLIEGVGGVMVPLDEKRTVLDWMAALKIPVVLVTGSYLGTLSHTLTALDVLGRAGLKPIRLVVNESDGAGVALSETVESLARFTEVSVAAIPRNPADLAAFSGILRR